MREDVGEFGREEEIKDCLSLVPDVSSLGAGDISLDRGVLSVASSEGKAESRSCSEVPGRSHVCCSFREGFPAMCVSMHRLVREDWT